jgi:hypothetical protein
VFYEIIYEDGSFSVANYESDEEATSAIEATHNRAVNGGRSLESVPNSPAAVRVVKVLKYKEHPGDLYASQELPVAVVKERVAELLKGGKEVNVAELTAELRNLTSPMVASGAHESNFAAEEDSEMEGPWMD